MLLLTPSFFSCPSLFSSSTILVPALSAATTDSFTPVCYWALSRRSLHLADSELPLPPNGRHYCMMSDGVWMLPGLMPRVGCDCSSISPVSQSAAKGSISLLSKDAKADFPFLSPSSPHVRRPSHVRIFSSSKTGRLGILLSMVPEASCCLCSGTKPYEEFRA